MINKSTGGWDKIISLFPEGKRNGQMDALIIWESLSQDEKKRVIRHCSVYVKNTQLNYLKQVGNYFKDRVWEEIKPEHSRKDNPMYNRKELLDGNFITYLMDNYDEINSIEEMVKTLTDISKEDLQELYQIYLKYKTRQKKYYMGDIMAQQDNEHGVTYWKDNRNRHYFGVWGNPMISLSETQYKLFKQYLRVYTSINNEKVYKDITPKDLKPYMIYCIKESHQANYVDKNKDVIDVKYLQEHLI